MKRGVGDFFDARTFAVVGASRDEKKVGFAVFRNLLESGRQVFPVNNKAEEILEEKCYKDLLEIPYDVDCVVLAIPAKGIPVILRHAAKKKTKCVVVLTAGFSEVGKTDVEKKILQIAEENNMKVLGPNSYGFIDPYQSLSTSYFEGIPKPGKIAFISQSGAIGSAILDSGQRLSGFVSVGNSSQLDFSDFIEYYSNDKNTSVIALYMESLGKDKGKRFIEVCKKCKKPVVVLKAGKSESGQKAAKSHTAALASEAGVYEGVLKQAGCIQVESIKQLFSVSKILSKFGKIKNKVAVVSNAGGLAVLTADYCEVNGINLKPLSKKTLEKLNKILPDNWSHNNPVDMVGTALAKDYYETLKVVQEEYSAIIVLLTPQKMTEGLETANVVRKLKIPVVTCFVGGHQVISARKFMRQHGIINFQDPKYMCESLGKVLN